MRLSSRKGAWSLSTPQASAGSRGNGAPSLCCRRRKLAIRPVLSRHAGAGGITKGRTACRQNRRSQLRRKLGKKGHCKNCHGCEARRAGPPNVSAGSRGRAGTQFRIGSERRRTRHSTSAVIPAKARSGRRHRSLGCRRCRSGRSSAVPDRNLASSSTARGTPRGCPSWG